MPGDSAAAQTLMPFVGPVDVVGAIVGIVLLVVRARIARPLGGVVGSALNSLMAGVGLFTLAFVVAAVLQSLNVMAMENTMVIHMILMILALVMIVLSARNLTGLIR